MMSMSDSGAARLLLLLLGVTHQGIISQQPAARPAAGNPEMLAFPRPAAQQLSEANLCLLLCGFR